jgi:hypothetical protein
MRRMTSDQPWWLTMPPAELAATILPLFSSHSCEVEQAVIPGIVSWFRTGAYTLPLGRGGFGNAPFENPDFRAAAEAIQVLEHAGLLMQVQGGDYIRIGLTRLGMHALQTNTVRQHLGLSDTPPTA